MEEDEYRGLRKSCPHCGSQLYIKRYVTEQGVETFADAVKFYVAEMQRDYDRLGRILASIKEQGAQHG